MNDSDQRWNNSHWDKYKKFSNWNHKKLSKTNYSRYSAGILPYTYDSTGKCLFLLGKDNDEDWSDFGGRCEFKDNNDEKITASREFYEETLGSVLNIHECMDKLNETTRNNLKITSKTLNGSPYYMFIIYIDYSNYNEAFNKIGNFIKYYFNNEKYQINKMMEKSCIRWVSIDTILNCIDNKNTKTPISLRSVFYKTLEGCKEQLVYLSK